MIQNVAKLDQGLMTRQGHQELQMATSILDNYFKLASIPSRTYQCVPAHEHSTVNKMHCVYGRARVLYAVQDV